MTFLSFTGLLLFLLFLSQVCSEQTDIVLSGEGQEFVMGYCFGADYIVIYKSIPGGEQLLGNSSQAHLPNTLPADQQRRISMSNETNLLGLMINDLKELDSGTYKRECWQNQKLISNHTEHLIVCKEEGSSKEIILNKDDGAEIRCNSPSIGLAGTSVRWYHEIPPQYKTTLLLDTSVSMEPLMEDLRGVVKVRENGALLVLDKTVLEKSTQFYCVVFKGKMCLSFQNYSPPDNSESRDVYVSKGDRVVLNCTTDGNQQHWDTPLGKINSNSMKNNQMYVSAGDKPETFSLIIPAVSDEHNGKYSCNSASTDIEYSLYLCPKSTSQEKLSHPGQQISLECDFGHENRSMVQWHRHMINTPDQYEFIGEIDDSSIIIAEPLKSRVSLSSSGVLTISYLTEKDEGVYRCVALTGPEFVDYGDYGDTDEYEDETTSEDDATDDEFIDVTVRCILKQEMIVKVVNRPNTLYAVVGGLVGLVLVVAVIAAVVIAKRRKGKQNSSIL